MKSRQKYRLKKVLRELLTQNYIFQDTVLGGYEHMVIKASFRLGQHSNSNMNIILAANALSEILKNINIQKTRI